MDLHSSNDGPKRGFLWFFGLFGTIRSWSAWSNNQRLINLEIWLEKMMCRGFKCQDSTSYFTNFLVGGIPTPLKNMTSSVGMMTFPNYMENNPNVPSTKQYFTNFKKDHLRGWFPESIHHNSRLRSRTNLPRLIWRETVGYDGIKWQHIAGIECYILTMVDNGQNIGCTDCTVMGHLSACNGDVMTIYNGDIMGIHWH